MRTPIRQAATGAGAALAVLAAASAAHATDPQPAELEVLASAATARAGQDQLVSQNRAVAYVLATDSAGRPVTDLAPAGSQGDERSFVSLPAGWSVDTLLVGAGGCNLAPTRFVNRGDGVYQISLMGRSTSGPCDWRPGEYVLQVGVDAAGFAGLSLGSFEVD